MCVCGYLLYILKPALCRLGENHEAGSPGFVLMHEASFGAPTAVEPNRSPMKSKYIQSLTGTAMQEVLQSHLDDEATAIASMGWLKECATKGKIPYTRVDQDSDPDAQFDPRAQWGPEVQIGVPGRQGGFFLVEHDETFGTDANFWELPAEQAAVLVEQANELRLAQRELLQMPDLRYLGSKKRKSTKPNKELSAANIRARNEIGGKELIDDEPEDKSDDEDASDEDDQQPTWGADISGCKKNHYAVVATEYCNSHGIQILKITEIVSTEESKHTFKGVEMTLDANNLTHSDKKCLSARWYLTGKEVPKIQKAWWVLAYCKMTKVGRTNWKLSRAVIRKIELLIHDQQLPLFQSISDEQPENIDRNRRGHEIGGNSSDESYEDSA